MKAYGKPVCTDLLACDLVSTLWIIAPLLQFQTLMALSLVPPPVARMWGCQGHQDTALIAAWWSLQKHTYIAYKDIVSASPSPAKISSQMYE